MESNTSFSILYVWSYRSGEYVLHNLDTGLFLKQEGLLFQASACSKLNVKSAVSNSVNCLQSGSNWLIFGNVPVSQLVLFLLLLGCNNFLHGYSSEVAMRHIGSIPLNLAQCASSFLVGFWDFIFSSSCLVLPFLTFSFGFLFCCHQETHSPYSYLRRNKDKKNLLS